MIDWSQYRFEQPVRCRITIRPYFDGRPAKPEAMALDGLTIELTPMWYMDENDPYPGEWALGEPGMRAVDGKLRSAGVGWIASGDVMPA